jgi:ATP adenylyltransferase
LNSFCCRFCGNLAVATRAPWDRVLWETPSFVITPTLGAIVEGWLLVISKRHHLCMGALPPAELHELQSVTHHAASVVQDLYGPVAIFEHGPAQPQQQVGCGVDHAHMHIVPTACDLIAGARKHLPEHVQWELTETFGSIHRYTRAERSYLYLEQYGRRLVASDQELPSQLFRRVIAAHIGEPERWNWREHPFHEQAEATARRLGGAFQRLAAWQNTAGHQGPA